MSLLISRFIYCKSTSKQQTSIFSGPDRKEGTLWSVWVFEARHWQELDPRPADVEAGTLTPRPNLLYKTQISNNLEQRSSDLESRLTIAGNEHMKNYIFILILERQFANIH